MTDTAVVWFRTDLRLHDNEALARALEGSDEVVPVYCFDPRAFETTMFGLEKTGPYRTRFLTESVRDLADSIAEHGGTLRIRQGRPERVVPDLAADCGAATVHYQSTPATEERAVEAGVTSALDDLGVDHRRFRGKTLYHPADLPTPIEGIDDTFTPWRTEVEDEATVRETIETPDFGGLSASDSEGEEEVPDSIETADGTPDDRGVLAFEGGESAGLARLESYVWEGDHLREYKETRNGLLGADYSSKLSAWLALGCLSPRRVHEAVQRYERERVANDSTYWLVFELLWRDFMTFQFEKHGRAFFTETGIRSVEREWSEEEAVFERWAAGETGIPFVDANMRELAEAGYMSNRGRQNVASFLTDVLGIDWRMGAARFESLLVDYDVCSNWGNWAYQAGVGNDSRDGYFNAIEQGKYYDEDGEYIRHWLPELDSLPAEACHEPWSLSADQREAYGAEAYPEPIVDAEAAYERLED